MSECSHNCGTCGENCSSRTQDKKSFLEALAPDYIRGFSVLGGEPLDPDNCETVLTIIKKVKEACPEKDIWCYTGYVYDRELLKREEEEPGKVLSEIFSCLDVLVDGEFVESKKNLNLRFKGSENQRIINVPKSLETGTIVLWDGEEYA